MAQFERVNAELFMDNAEFRSSRAEIDYSQVRLPRFLDQNEKSQSPRDRMTNLEATMAKLERGHVECATSQVQLIQLTRANVQI